MPNWSAKSLAQLTTCDQRLQDLFNEVVKHYDCTVLEGKRSEHQQQLNVLHGVSKTLESKHVYPLGEPSRAADVAPYPLSWPNRASETYTKDVARWYLFAGFVKGIAQRMGIAVRWGGDWDMDWTIVDQVFDDLAHFELVD